MFPNAKSCHWKRQIIKPFQEYNHNFNCFTNVYVVWAVACLKSHLKGHVHKKMLATVYTHVLYLLLRAAGSMNTNSPSSKNSGISNSWNRNVNNNTVRSVVSIIKQPRRHTSTVHSIAAQAFHTCIEIKLQSSHIVDWEQEGFNYKSFLYTVILSCLLAVKLCLRKWIKRLARICFTRCNCIELHT
jgi:hypothetical protein